MGVAFQPSGPVACSARLSVCIVAYNNEDTIGGCLRAVRKACDAFEAEVIVVDNASRDGTAAVVAQFGPGVALSRASRNLGFAAACNRALQRARGEFVLFLNPDTEPTPDSLSSMLDYMAKHPGVGLLGCVLREPRGKHQRSVRDFPTFGSAFHQFTILRLLAVCKQEYLRYRMRDFDYARTTPVGAVMGAAILARRDVLQQVGGFDERFFMYYEDVDLCKSIWNAGLKVVYFADATILHLGGHSARQSRRLVLCERLRSLMKYFAKHEGAARTRAFKLFFIPLLEMQLLLDIPLDFLKAVKYRLRRDRYRCDRKLKHAATKIAFFLWDWTKVASA